VTAVVADGLVALWEEGDVVVLVHGWGAFCFLVVLAAAAGVTEDAAGLEEDGWAFLDWTTACVCSVSLYFFAIVVVDFVAAFFSAFADCLEEGGKAFFLDLDSTTTVGRSSVSFFFALLVGVGDDDEDDLVRVLAFYFGLADDSSKLLEALAFAPGEEVALAALWVKIWWTTLVFDDCHGRWLVEKLLYRQSSKPLKHFRKH
jgi:hypothetical protein